MFERDRLNQPKATHLQQRIDQDDGQHECVQKRLHHAHFLVLQTHINFPKFLPIFPDFLERLSHLAPIY
jgi:hypothetical protein